MDIVKYFYAEPDFKRYIRDHAGNYWEDFYQDMYFILVKLNPELINQAIENGKLKPFILAVLVNQLKSRSSDFYVTYKRLPDSDKYNHELKCEFDYDQQVDEIAEEVEIILNQPKNLTENMQNELMRHYIKAGSYNKTHKAVNGVISKHVIRYNIECCRDRLKKKIDQIKKKDI